MDAVLNATTEDFLDPSTYFTFSWFDYVLFILMLALSTAIGIYFGFFGTKQSTANEYLLGDKNMSVIPIAVSLTASNVSGITLLAVPTDVYRFGAYYWVYCIVLIPVYFATYYVFIPVFYKLQLTSTYEYLEIRFNKRIRHFASFLYTISNLLWLPIVIYIPALALGQVTNIDLHYVTPALCAICIFYTTIGGLKAVVWTDTLQFIAMVGSMFAVFCLGIHSVGGFEAMWQKSIRGQRLDFDSDLDPTKRYTISSSLVGTLFSGLSYICISQGCVQKYLALPTKADVKKALLLFFVSLAIIITISVVTGLIMYAKYEYCDPHTAKKIAQHDQIVPFYVMEIARAIPGLSGLFVSGVFSAALSSLSAAMNSLSGCIYEDFISPYMSTNITQKKISNILKTIVVIVGIITTLLVYVIEYMGNSLLQINYTLGGIAAGPLLGLFALGVLAPIANSKGALFGGFGSMAIMKFIVIGSEINKSKGLVQYEIKPISIEGCNATLSAFSEMTNHVANSSDSDEILYIFKITYFYYICIGTLLVLLIGIPVSLITKRDKPLNPDLIAPICHWMIKKDQVEKGIYMDVKQANEIVSATKK